MVTVTSHARGHAGAPPKVSGSSLAGGTMRQQGRIIGRRTAGVVASLLAISMLATGCGGKKAGDKAESLDSAELNSAAGETGLDKAGDPVRGGTITYGMEADSNDGFCLPEGQ